MAGYFNRNRILSARIALVLMPVILVRTLAAALYKLNANPDSAVTGMHMYLVGGLVASAAILVMLLLYFRQQFTWVTVLAGITIIVLIGIKVYYMGWRP